MDNPNNQNDSKKSIKGIVIALVITILLFLGIAGYAVYDKYIANKKETPVKKEEVNKEVIKLTDDEAENVLNNLPNGFATAHSDSNGKRYKGIYWDSEVNIDTISDNVLLESAFNEYIGKLNIGTEDLISYFEKNNTESKTFEGWGSKEKTKAYFKASEITDIAKKLFNKDVTNGSFYAFSCYYISYNDGYYGITNIPATCGYPIQKNYAIVNHNNDDNKLTIDEKVVLYREGTEINHGKYEIFKNLNHDHDTRVIKKTEEALNQEFEDNGVTYTHTFIKENGNWYWNKTSIKK